MHARIVEQRSDIDHLFGQLVGRKVEGASGGVDKAIDDFQLIENVSEPRKAERVARVIERGKTAVEERAIAFGD